MDCAAYSSHYYSDSVSLYARQPDPDCINGVIKITKPRRITMTRIAHINRHLDSLIAGIIGAAPFLDSSAACSQ